MPLPVQKEHLLKPKPEQYVPSEDAARRHTKSLTRPEHVTHSVSQVQRRDEKSMREIISDSGWQS